jgi:membrane protease YdiL (CAAX protease family)
MKYPWVTLLPATPPEPATPEPDAPQSPLGQRLIALIEVFICSDYPTQLALAATLVALGYSPVGSDGSLQVGFVAWLSLIDAVLLVALILLFLHAHGERPREVLFGRRPITGEVVHGLLLTLVVLMIGVGALVAIRYLLPSLQTAPRNPLEDFLDSPRDAWLFALVVLIAGGVREEIQRAFLLHRFEVWLGGATVGTIVTSVAFGAGHILQGIDAAIVTGLLGAFWAAVYFRRRSAVAPMVSHAGFNLLQVLQYVTTRQ